MRTSVIIPSYNVEAFLTETIESVLAQSRSVNEIFVVDDGSTDSTAAVARRFGPPVRLLQQQNAGASVARNLGLERASGDLISFLDADDIWLPEKLERQISYLNEHEEAVAVGASFTVFGDGLKPRDVLMVDSTLRRFGPLDFLTSPRVHPSTLLVRGEVAKVVRFPAGISDVEDVIYAALLRVQGPIGSVEEVLMRRREHPGQITKTALHFGRGVAKRAAWARANFETLGADSSDAAAAAVFCCAVEDALARYWMRDLGEFKQMRRELLGIWPENEPVPTALMRTLPPRLLLRLKDLFDGLR